MDLRDVPARSDLHSKFVHKDSVYKRLEKTDLNPSVGTAKSSMTSTSHGIMPHLLFLNPNLHRTRHQIYPTSASANAPIELTSTNRLPNVKMRREEFPLDLQRQTAGI